MRENEIEAEKLTQKEDFLPSDGAACCVSLSGSECAEIADILGRRANELATFRTDLEADVGKKLNGFPGSVQLAIYREIDRLRSLQEKVKNLSHNA